ncbi:asparagine synthase-related protein [Metabacillus indicus]|uniref:asparagine synthase-related protein n=1 Tax=Metabacillus indicus TaxID=246786 RepID=UPI003983F093
MSAIVGIVDLHNKDVRYEEAEKMMSVLSKFPSDDIRLWHKEHVFFGCHAQWITPEAVGEVLPFYDSVSGFAITADAIIDNRTELIEMLSEDRTFTGITDSQLILMAYRKWGEDAPKYIIGDFAFVIWDAHKNKLFAARDFSGSRTLYYFNNSRKFVFSTIIEPLFSAGQKKEVNEKWMAEFVAIPVTSDSSTAEETVYKEVFQVPPGHSLSIKNGVMKVKRYHWFDYSYKLHLASNGEYEEAFRDVFKRAVADRIRSRKGVGAQLSGGLDSGTVASFAARALLEKKQTLQTFSYVPVDGFSDWTHRYRVADERPHIKSTVDYVGNINDQYSSFPKSNPYSEIDEWLDIMEMPYKFFENSFWIKGIYEQAAAQNIGILLNGQRGNWTISFGPALDHYARLLKKCSFFVLYKEIKLYSQHIGVDQMRIMKFVRKKAFPSVSKWIDRDASEGFPVWINSQFAEKNDVFSHLNERGIDVTGIGITDAYQMKRLQFEQSHIWALNGTIGTKLSLRHALWERDPTNDLRVVQFCLSVPDDQYVQNGRDRSLVRRATNGWLPDEIRLNQKSRGVQGADGVHRMKAEWESFIQEVNHALDAPRIVSMLNQPLLKDYLKKISGEFKPGLIFEFEFRVLMRCLILYRFLTLFEGR